MNNSNTSQSSSLTNQGSGEVELSQFSERLKSLLELGAQLPIMAVMSHEAEFASAVLAAVKPSSRILAVQVFRDRLDFSGEINGDLTGFEMHSFPQMIKHLASKPGGDLVVTLSRTEAAGPELSSVFMQLAQDYLKVPAASLIFQTSQLDDAPAPLVNRCFTLFNEPPMQLGSWLASRRELSVAEDKNAPTPISKLAV